MKPERNRVRGSRPKLSPHQKQVRFFAVLFVVFFLVLVVSGLWYLNRSGH
jgi:hypothetical protein